MGVKNAYIILAHKDPQQVQRFAKALDDDDAIFIFHICKNASRETFDEFKSLLNSPNHHFCKRVRSFWGEIGLVQAALNGFRWLESLNLHYDRVHLLSGQDYPIKSNSERKAFLEQNLDSEFVQYWKLYPLPEEDKIGHWFRYSKHFQQIRLQRYYIRLFGNKYVIPSKYDLSLKQMSLTNAVFFYLKNLPDYLRNGQFAVKTIEWLLTRILKYPRPIPPIQFYVGSAWISITRNAVKYIIEFDNSDNQLKSFYSKTLLPDESYFQTVLLNSSFKTKVVNYHLREIIHPSPNPIILTDEHFELLKNSKALFARKFDSTQSNGLMERIDNKLILHRKTE